MVLLHTLPMAFLSTLLLSQLAASVALAKRGWSSFCEMDNDWRVCGTQLMPGSNNSVMVTDLCTN